MSDGPQFTGKCPMCGYSDKTAVKPVSNVMNTYKNEKGEVAVLPSFEQEVKTDKCTWTLLPKTKDQEILSLRPVPGVVAMQTQTAAIAATNTPAAPFSDAGDYATGLAKGATIKGK